LASTVHDPGQLVAAPSHRYGEQLGPPGEPAGTTEQVPRLPDTLQASQLAPHVVLQQ
jgi:hypothetical protein